MTGELIPFPGAALPSGVSLNPPIPQLPDIDGLSNDDALIALREHMAAIYRWLENYDGSEREETECGERQDECYRAALAIKADSANGAAAKLAMHRQYYEGCDVDAYELAENIIRDWEAS